MSRRRLILPAGFAVGLILMAGCQARVDRSGATAVPSVARISGPGSISSPTIPAEPVRKEGPLPAPPAESARPTGLQLFPEAFTIASDDSGLQLLAVKDDGGSSVDVTAEVDWTVLPAGLAAIEPGGYLRPIGEGTATVTAKLPPLTSLSVTSRIRRPARSVMYLICFRP